MSLLYNRALISHLVVIELLHDVQLAAGVRGSKLGLERSPHVLAVVKRHIRIHNGVIKNTQKSAFKEGIDLLKSFQLCWIKIALRLALGGIIAAHGLKPVDCSRAPPLILRPLKGRRLQMRSKTTRSKLPIIRFLDCWKYEQVTTRFNLNN